MDMKNWVATNLSNPKAFVWTKDEWELMFCAVLWQLWRNRNCVIFEPSSVVSDSVLQSSFSLARSVGSVCGGAPVVRSTNVGPWQAEAGWSPPPPGWIKLNADGEQWGSAGCFACGGVAHGNGGEWISPSYSGMG
ncbi:hypothetical protein V6N13_009472 [Hibiscus sabdariffa]